jgi:DNA modification methylase
VIRVLQGDCAALLPTLDMHDVVLTDPPYNAINRATGGLRSFDKGTADSAPVDIAVIAPLLWEKARHSVYVWCSDEQYTAWTMAFKGLGATTRKCAWWKSNPSPMNGDKMWTSALELCVYARKPKAYHNAHCAPPVWKGPVARRDGHPTPKPVWLMREILSVSCPPGGSVIDPFAGGGSTLVAARELGLTATGIELSPEYCSLIHSKLLPEAA